MANNQSRNYSMNNCYNYATITSSIGSSRYGTDDAHVAEFGKCSGPGQRMSRLQIVWWNLLLSRQVENEIFSISYGGIKCGSCLSCHNTNYRQNITASKQKLRDLLNCEIFVTKIYILKNIECRLKNHPPPSTLGRSRGWEQTLIILTSLAIRVNSLSYVQLPHPMEICLS